MDEYDATVILKRLYKLENRSSTKLGTEQQYVDFHIKFIKAQNNGEWNASFAREYIENLESSI